MNRHVTQILTLALVAMAVAVGVQFAPDLGYDWTEDRQYLNGECSDEFGYEWRAASTPGPDRMLTCTNGTANRTFDPHDGKLVPA